MARELVNVPNVDAPSGDYPNGRVRDKVGATIGTTYSEILHGDIIQFFQKLIIDGSITENNLPDNVSNGYQLFDALTAEIKAKSSASATIVELYNAVFNAGSFAITSEPYDRMIYVLSNELTAGYEISAEFSGNIVGWANGTNAVSFLLPANVAGDVSHIAATGSLTVRTQQVGV